ncbi:LysR family transcriptional regulator [Youhaiella tibetensis]|uniref:LysR family transcriptional regulator n=1 Tax=Paradevosia tibetensis TaxID=1447062 RepID=A0A5B9DNV8_9HYPH|nr:LysR family transcriptional regulator [Youhaiella tibetensis]QEE20178.1 LysR family transcriptional regulator [Youhaiella tibetensis]GGF26456.1 LysR family transcriptional regulator [Youhaiella tibetensis]
MPSDNLNDIAAFIAVAHERSFTKAGAKLGVTPSALSHSVRGLEERLGIRLLARTTRSVSPTEAGERLVRSLGPLLEQVSVELAGLSELRDRPAGTVRITCNDYVIGTIFRPKLGDFLRRYPDIKVELIIDYGFTDIVEERFDAGVRLGEALSKDMIAVPIGPDWRFVVVGAPEYLADHPAPETPQELTEHICMNYRLTGAGSVYAWEFEKDGRKVNVKVDGQLTFNSAIPVLNAAVDGLGLAYVPEDLAAPYLSDGRLKLVLDDWCPVIQGYHLYYPNRRQASPAFALLVEALRYRR